jgi:hypothetical protein
MMALRSVLRRLQKPVRVQRMPDGTRLLVLPHGGRVLGLFAPRSDENFYWTHPALKSAAEARAFYAREAWHNSGGDRTWLAPEVDVFLPDFPKLDRYEQPRALDPGRYRVIERKPAFELENRLTLRLSRSKSEVGVKISKSFRPAPNPLRHERGIDLRSVEYAGYTQQVSLELIGASRTTTAQIGLWSLVQMPHGGDLLMPTFSRNEPRHIFSTVGTIPRDDLVVSEHLVRYRMRQKGEHKISLRAAPMAGRAGYLYRSGSQWSLVVRNFVVNPAGEYVDVPWNEPDWLGFAVQACNVNSALGAFSELEYHTPVTGQRPEARHCTDTSQIWAFRGSRPRILRIARLLVTGRDFSP